MKRVFIVVLLSLMSLPVMARDLGQDGKTYRIIEPDFLAFIHERLQGLQRNGEMARFEMNAKNRIAAHVKRPGNLGLTRIDKTHHYTLDPTVTISRTIALPNGRVLAYQGQRLNPLNHVHLTKTFIFFNGDDVTQWAWVMREQHRLINPQWILTGGDITVAANKLGRIYFDQQARLVTHFHIHHVPAIVKQVGNQWQITVVAISPQGASL